VTRFKTEDVDVAGLWLGVLEDQEHSQWTPKTGLLDNSEIGCCFFGQQPFVPLLLLLGPPFFPIILFWSTTLLTGMTGNSLHMQWPLTSQSDGSVSQREQLFFHYGSNSM
jgi:hypothetical protein